MLKTRKEFHEKFHQTKCKNKIKRLENVQGQKWGDDSILLSLVTYYGCSNNHKINGGKTERRI